jgi:hypothetical protein
LSENLKEKFDIYLRRLQNSGWEDIIQRSMDVLKEFNDARQNPSAYSMVRATLAAAKALHVNDLYMHEVLDRSVWKKFVPDCLRMQLLEILEPHVTSRSKMNRAGDTVLYSITAPNVKIAWVKNHDENETTEILAHVDFVETSAQWVRDVLWSSVDPDRIVISSFENVSNDVPRHSGSYGQLRIVTDDLIEFASSKVSKEQSEYLLKCINAGIRRTVLFHGPAGTGKSTIARQICHTLALRSLRVRVEDVGTLGSGPISEIIKMFEPDVVIFDDLDRATSQIALFEMLEMLHKSTKLVFATVNHLNSLQDALKRPGRFDEIIPIVKLDEVAILKVLGDYKDAYELVKDWPVAFIKEYTVRRRILGAEQALKAVKNLQVRVKELMKGYDDILEEESFSNDRLDGIFSDDP